jgi:S-formylglutathione hydrolase FrmB
VLFWLSNVPSLCCSQGSASFRILRNLFLFLLIFSILIIFRRYEHASSVLGCTMMFSVIDGSGGSGAKLPVIYWLSGLTCTDRNFIEKAGAFKAAADHGVLIVCPDTSPRVLAESMFLLVPYRFS